MKIMLEDHFLIKFENNERPFQGIWSVKPAKIQIKLCFKSSRASNLAVDKIHEAPSEIEIRFKDRENEKYDTVVQLGPSFKSQVQGLDQSGTLKYLLTTTTNHPPTSNF